MIVNITSEEQVKAIVDERLSKCWISFTDENGNPTDEPYIHWLEEVND